MDGIEQACIAYNALRENNSIIQFANHKTLEETGKKILVGDKLQLAGLFWLEDSSSRIISDEEIFQYMSRFYRHKKCMKHIMNIMILEDDPMQDQVETLWHEVLHTGPEYVKRLITDDWNEKHVNLENCIERDVQLIMASPGLRRLGTSILEYMKSSRIKRLESRPGSLPRLDHYISMQASCEQLLPQPLSSWGKPQYSS